MYFGNLQIKSIDGNILNLENGKSIEITEENRKLFTDEPITGTSFRDKWKDLVVRDILDILEKHNIRLTDIAYIFDNINKVILEKNDEALVNAFGKEKLETITNIFGGSDGVKQLDVMNIRLKDII